MNLLPSFGFGFYTVLPGAIRTLCQEYLGFIARLLSPQAHYHFYLCLQSVHNVRPIGQYFGLLPDPKQSMQTKLKSIFSISPDPLQVGQSEAMCLKATVSNNPFSLLPVGVP